MKQLSDTYQTSKKAMQLMEYQTIDIMYIISMIRP